MAKKIFKKNKKPEAVFTPDGFFVSVTAVRRMIKEAGEKFLKYRAEDFEEYMQEMLNNGADINIRRSKKAFKASEDEYRHLLKIIDALLESSEEATVTENNRMKD